MDIITEHLLPYKFISKLANVSEYFRHPLSTNQSYKYNMYNIYIENRSTKLHLLYTKYTYVIILEIFILHIMLAATYECTNRKSRHWLSSLSARDNRINSLLQVKFTGLKSNALNDCL